MVEQFKVRFVVKQGEADLLNSLIVEGALLQDIKDLLKLHGVGASVELADRPAQYWAEAPNGSFG